METSPLQVLGPWDVLDNTGHEGTPVTTVPYSRVAGSNLLLHVIDNFGIAMVSPSVLVRFWAAAEIGIWGVVQGYEYLLARQHTRMTTGPMVYNVATDEPYDSIVIKARNMSGGNNGPPATGFTPTTAAGFFIKVQMHIQAQGGQGIGPLAQYSGAQAIAKGKWRA